VDLRRPEVARVEKVPTSCVFLEKRLLTKKFSNICSERIHRLTNRHVVCKVREIWPMGNWQSCVLFTWQKKQNFASFSRSRFCMDRAKICQGQPYTMYYEWIECSRFHPNRFTFGRVISECVNTIRARSKVNAVFGWSLASSRIKIKSHHINSHNKSYSNLCCNHRYESRNSWPVIFNHCSTKKDSAASIIIITLELQHRKVLLIETTI